MQIMIPLREYKNFKKRFLCLKKNINKTLKITVQEQNSKMFNYNLKCLNLKKLTKSQFQKKETSLN